jgi:hypothetical protein
MVVLDELGFGAAVAQRCAEEVVALAAPGVKVVRVSGLSS